MLFNKYPKELNENLCPCKHLTLNFYRSFVHNYQNLEVTKVSFTRINKAWYIQITEYYSALKTNELLSHKKTQRTLKCISLRERHQYE